MDLNPSFVFSVDPESDVTSITFSGREQQKQGWFGRKPGFDDLQSSARCEWHIEDFEEFLAFAQRFLHEHREIAVADGGSRSGSRERNGRRRAGNEI